MITEVVFYPKFPAGQWNNANYRRCDTDDGQSSQGARDDVHRGDNQDRKRQANADHDAEQCRRRQLLKGE